MNSFKALALAVIALTTFMVMPIKARWYERSGRGFFGHPYNGNHLPEWRREEYPWRYQDTISSGGRYFPYVGYPYGEKREAYPRVYKPR